MNVPWTLVAAIVGGCLAIVGSLIVLNLRSIKNCLRSQNKQVENTQVDLKQLQTGFADCKLDCDRTFVKSEVFLRETGFTRRALEDLTASASRLEGKLTVVDQLPKICGDISREIVKEMKNGETNG
jgi:hypothetical protein